jgi:dienelactone hydrolase
MTILRLSCSAFTAAILIAEGAFSAPAGAADFTPVAKPGFSLVEASIGDAGIPALLLSKEGVERSKRPVVILVHGGSICDAVATHGVPYKEEWFRPVYEDVPYRLAGKGMLVVAIDASWAETRITPGVREQVQNSPVEAVFTFYMAAVRDVSQTIDYLRARPDVDPGRIGLAGKSGGAMTCLMAACQEPRLAAVVSWKGGADFIEMARLRGQEAVFEEALKQHAGFREKLKRADPINNYERIPPKALALINNRDDPLIPRESAEALYEKLRPLYERHPDRLLLKLCETDKPTHDDQVEAFDAGCQWLEDHLLPCAKDDK